MYSLSFLIMHFSLMLKALHICDQSKGYFPHTFSSEEHLNHIWPYPPPIKYGTKCMTWLSRKSFLYGTVKQVRGLLPLKGRLWDISKTAIFSQKVASDSEGISFQMHMSIYLTQSQQCPHDYVSNTLPSVQNPSNTLSDTSKKHI